MASIPRPRTFDLRPETTITLLAQHPILDSLTGRQLVVYLRLLAATGAQRKRAVKVTNHELYRDARGAVRTVLELQQLGLVKVRFEHDRKKLGRTIQVLR